MNVSGTGFSDLSIVFDSLRRGLGVWAARGWVGHVMALLVYSRLGRAQQEMRRLMALFQAGMLRRRAPRTVAVAAEVVEKPARMPRILPVGFAWLVKLAKWEAAGLGGQLQHVLEQPEMMALLLACPQARRVMAPICRMLAIPAHVARPRPDGFVPEVAPKVKRALAPRPPIDWGRIPLPRGVLTAARRLKTVR